MQLVKSLHENQIVIYGAERDYSEKYKKMWIMHWNDNELLQEKYAHGGLMKLTEHR